MKVYIKDNEGNLIEVKELQAAILQVAEYIHYLHGDSAPELHRFDQRRQAYWKDVFKKLNELKALKQNSTDIN